MQVSYVKGVTHQIQYSLSFSLQNHDRYAKVVAVGYQLFSIPNQQYDLAFSFLQFSPFFFTKLQC